MHRPEEMGSLSKLVRINHLMAVGIEQAAQAREKRGREPVGVLCPITYCKGRPEPILLIYQADA